MENVWNCWPSLHSPGAVVSLPPRKCWEKVRNRERSCPHPSSRFCGSENVREMSGNIQGLWGAPPPSPTPPRAGGSPKKVRKMLGKCSENVRNWAGGAPSSTHHRGHRGGGFPNFQNLGWGPRPSLTGILAPRSYVLKMAGKCLELVGAPIPHPSRGGGSPEIARAGMAVVLTVLADIEHVSLTHLRKAGGGRFTRRLGQTPRM